MIKLKRSYLDNCTTGKIYFNSEFICYTLEKPWDNNEKNISCIPAGVYQLEPYQSAKYKDCFALTCFNLNVGLTDKFHRTFILIHSANYVEQLEGCIAPGLQLRQEISGDQEKCSVIYSRDALAKLRILIDEHEIKQIEVT